MKFTVLIGTAIGLVFLVAMLPAPAGAAEVDVLIRNGTVVDGTGARGVLADVAIDAGRIVAMGKLQGVTAKEVIDARDRVVCPGFIDLHSHGDGGILQYPAAENYIRQGVTTLVCGNCGSSPVNVAEYFAMLREKGTGLNIALLIGHGSVRREVVGSLNVPPTEQQLVQMRRLVREAMQAGAVGMSTGLTYSPSAYGTTEEIVALAKELAPGGGFYATHIRDEGTKVFEALDEALKIGREACVPVHISHHKISAVSVFGLTRLTLQRIDEARAAGQDVTLDQYPYGAGSGSLSFYVPQASLSGGMDAYRRRIADPTQRAEIVAGVADVFVRKLFEAGQSPENDEHAAAALARVQVARAPHDPALAGKNLAEILRSRGQEVTVKNGAEALVDLVGREAVGINHTLDARPGGDVDRVMQHPLTAIASDGSVFEFGIDSPHPRSYGCFPRVLGHYVRERKLIELEAAIHKMTQLPARRLGWPDRGVIAEGSWADIVVFDARTVADKATFLQPHQHSVGIEQVLVRGQFVLRSGQMTGELPGRPLPGQGARRERAKAAAGSGAADAVATPIPLPATTPWNLKKLSEDPDFEWQDDKGPVRSLFYEGEPLGGKPTRVFAYYATPGTLAGDLSKDKSLPAVVLVHGGGGTAFREWAELWAKRGYAAIAMDLAGYRPDEGKNAHQRENRTRLTDGGPDQGDTEKFGSVDQPATEQWPYHAVAAVLRAHSLVRRFREVDADRTAVTGISWGGYLTCIVAGVDNRFRAAVPVYGCGFLHENSAWVDRLMKMTPQQRERWVTLWDPSQYLPAVEMPILFVNGTNDFAYPLDSHTKSFDVVRGVKQLRITVNMPHGHPAGWAPAEIGLFVDHHLLGKPGLTTLGTPQIADKRVRLTYTSPVKLVKAELQQTVDGGPINKRQWTTLPAKLDEDAVTADAPPAAATAWFLTVTDDRGAVVSSRVVKRAAE